ncbi:MAG: hypothetical protein K0Q59_434 [Paenibacillus sp.]|nr:hypothetical protein [Paenibacillus sp.]
MNEWMDSLQPSTIFFALLGITLIVVVLFIMMIVLSVKLSRLRRNYAKMIEGTEPKNLEQLIIDQKQALNRCTSQLNQHQQQLEGVESAIQQMSGKVGVIRYNAFGERGSDLSFSVAIMSEKQDGVVLTGIHNRDETYVYAKPITGGQSEYRLTPEEKEAISQCTVRAILK